jgi:radical SAM superfamily enzyme YgiQ (UPF0313 family)
VDIVVVGEAETTWPRVLQDVERDVVHPPGHHTLDSVTGLSVEVLSNRAPIYRCQRAASLKGLRHARRDLIRHGGWNKWWVTRGAIIATRGCPHQCDYCSISLMYPQARHMRFRPVEEVIAEVAAMPDKGIVFWDDNLGANPQYAKDLFRGLIPLKRWWTSQTTMASVRDDAMLELAARSGCKALFLGLESVSQVSLAGAAKGHNRVSEYKRLLERLHGYGIAAQAGLMFGFEDDTKDIFRRTVEVMGDIGLDNATISVMVPYPGTPAYARLRAEGRIIDYDWRHYNGKTHVVYRPRHMTPDELLAGYQWAKTQFYSPEHIFKRLNVSRTGLWWNIPRNLGYVFHPNQDSSPNGSRWWARCRTGRRARHRLIASSISPKPARTRSWAGFLETKQRQSRSRTLAGGAVRCVCRPEGEESDLFANGGPAGVLRSAKGPPAALTAGLAGAGSTIERLGFTIAAIRLGVDPCGTSPRDSARPVR